MNSEKTEVTPDKVSHAKYGHIEGGDGRLYRVVRGGFNERGRRLEDLISRLVKPAEEGGDPNEGYSTARELFVTALEPFYDRVRVEALLEEGIFSWSDAGAIVAVVSGDDVAETLSKKE